MTADAWAVNPADGTVIRFRDEGGSGVPLAILGGFLDPIEVVARTPLVRALPRDPFRRIWIDHRGHGRSGAPTDPSSYRIALRVGDVLAVLDDVQLDRASVLGLSWGGRLGFGMVDRAPDRVRSFVSIGQHPYELRDDGPLGRVLSAGMAASGTRGMAAIIEAFEDLVGRYPDEVRDAYLGEDAAAMRAAWSCALAEGPVARHLGTWALPCCICVAAGDEDFADDARRASVEIPGARFIVIEGTDHLGVDTVEADPFLNAVVDTLLDERRS